MMTSQSRRYVLLGLAFLLLILGGLGVYFGSHNNPIRALGVIAVMASAQVVRMSRGRDGPSLSDTAGLGLEPKTTDGPGRVLWIVSIALVPLLVVALLLMHMDAVNGGNDAWPADFFAGVAFVCAIVWSYLGIKISVRK